MSETRIPALVVGGGIAGLSSALFLAWHGVRCVLVERHPDLLIHPRARGLTPRTMEVYRQVGLEPAIRQAAFAGPGFAWTPVLAETLNDAEYGAPDEPPEDDGANASPSSFGPIDQDKLEVLVRDEARRLGADLRFATEMTSFQQDADGVRAVLRERQTGAEQAVRADYLIAADGVNSGIRKQLGIGVDGPGTLFTTLTAIVDADLTPALRGRRASIAYLQRPQPFTILMAHDDAGKRWVFGTGYDPNREPIEQYTDQRVADLVRAAAGLPDVDVRVNPQIPGTELKVLHFPIVAHVAQSYQLGRVFLVGDAAHSWPPTGGLGANAGIQDAHNLAWKLALVVNGEATASLLDSYQPERQPVGRLSMGQAMARFGTRMGPGDVTDVIAYGAVAMGYRYRSRAIPGASGVDERPLAPADLAGLPGTRAPHVEIALGGRQMSTLDLYGRRFVLLAGSDGVAWMSAAAQQRVGLAAYRFGVELQPAEAAAAHGIGSGGALLVRPDGFVAWRTAEPPTDPDHELTGVMESILGTSK